MGVLVNGEWRVDGKFPADPGTGHFVRPDTSFRNWITPDGAPGPTGKGGFAAEAGRYHLYVSFACPWAHRTLIFRKLKGLEELIDVSVVNWFMGDNGWTFAPGRGVVPDRRQSRRSSLREIYVASKPDYTGRVSVPVLWDKETRPDRQQRIRPTSSACSTAPSTASALRPATITPQELREEIEPLNARIYATVNNGVYRCGFARTQVGL